jgi:hypothetical protein
MFFEISICGKGRQDKTNRRPMAHGRMATPFVSRVRLYGLRANRWAVRNPLKLSIAVTTFKAGAADLLVQRCIEGKKRRGANLEVWFQ